MAASFSGTGQYLTFTLSSALNGKAGVTLMAWFNGPAAAATSGIVMLSIGTTPASQNGRARLQLIATGVKPMQFQGRNTNDAGALVTNDATTLVPVSTWCHLAVSLDLAGTDSLTFYRNGVADGNFTNQYTPTTWPATDSETASIAAQNSGGSNLLTGKLADVRVYDRALSAAEIVGIYYARGADNNRNGLMHQWLLNELSVGSTLTAPKDTGVIIKNPTVVGSPTYFEHPVRRRSYY